MNLKIVSIKELVNKLELVHNTVIDRLMHPFYFGNFFDKDKVIKKFPWLKNNFSDVFSKTGSHAKSYVPIVSPNVDKLKFLQLRIRGLTMADLNSLVDYLEKNKGFRGQPLLAVFFKDINYFIRTMNNIMKKKAENADYKWGFVYDEMRSVIEIIKSLYQADFPEMAGYDYFNPKLSGSLLNQNPFGKIYQDEKTSIVDNDIRHLNYPADRKKYLNFLKDYLIARYGFPKVFKPEVYASLIASSLDYNNFNVDFLRINPGMVKGVIPVELPCKDDKQRSEVTTKDDAQSSLFEEY